MPCPSDELLNCLVQPSDDVDINQLASIWSHVERCNRCLTRLVNLQWEFLLTTQPRSFKELQEFLGPSFRPYHDARAELAEEWTRMQPASPSKIEDFYRTTSNYLYDQTLYHLAGFRWPYELWLSKIVRAYKVKTVLDFGCGTGESGLKLSELVPTLHVVYMDFRNPSTAFLAWRLQKRQIESRIYYVGEDDIPVVDMIFALDVLEHIVDPVATIERMARKCCVLFFAAPFGFDELWPMHLHDASMSKQIEDKLAQYNFKKAPVPLPEIAALYVNRLKRP